MNEKTRSANGAVDGPDTAIGLSAHAVHRPTTPDYDAPRIEKIYAAADLERESLYAGTFTGTPI